MAEKCLPGICNSQRTQGLQTNPSGGHKLVVLEGPGLFVSAHVSKQGGDTDLTFVSLDLDGENVVNISYAAARNLGFTQSNPYGLVLLQTRPIDNLTIGYPAPLHFERELLLSVQVNEPNVAQILANVIHGTP